MDIQKTIDYCLSLNYNELEEFAKINYQKLYDYFKTKQSSEKVKAVLEGSVLTCVFADGKLASEEFNIIKSLLGEYSYENLVKITEEYYSFDAQETIKRLYDNLNGEMQKVFINLCIAVLTVDKDVDFSEDFLLNLLTNIQDY